MSFRKLLSVATACLIVCGTFTHIDAADQVSSHSKKKEKETKITHKLAVAAIFRDEAPYIREWVEYHYMQGATHFFLYNNLSADNYKEVLAPYVASGLVELFEWARSPNPTGNVEASFNAIQIDAYRDALVRAKKTCTWIAFIDLDEFLVPVKHSNVVALLNKYEHQSNVGGICLPWVVYGTSHVEKIPADRLLIETLLLNAGQIAQGDPITIFQTGNFKSIARTKYVEGINSPHYCIYKSGRQHIMTGYDEALINHYWTRDENYLYNNKIPRRETWGTSTQTVLDWASKLNEDTPYGRSILRFVPELRKRMGFSH